MKINELNKRGRMQIIPDKVSERGRTKTDDSGRKEDRGTKRTREPLLRLGWKDGMAKTGRNLRPRRGPEFSELRAF